MENQLIQIQLIIQGLTIIAFYFIYENIKYKIIKFKNEINNNTPIR